MAVQDPLPITPVAGPFTLSLSPPGSKSLTNRAYLLAALARGSSRLCRPLRSDDCDRLLKALSTLGAASRWDGDDVILGGVDGRFPNGGTLDLGDGGTPTRFMIAAAALAAQPVIIDGSRRMRERPVEEGVDMLRELGADIVYLGEGPHLPLEVRPAPMTGGTLTVGATASSQFISALMLIAPWLPDGLDLRFDTEPTSRSYLDLTRDTLHDFGAKVSAFAIPLGPLDAHDLEIEPDASSALYWHAAAALVPGASITTPGLRGRQPDERAIAHLPGRVTGDPTRTVGHDSFELGTIDAELWPDGALALAAVAARSTTPTTITGLATLVVKETDRLTALANELRRLGATVDVTRDSISIDPSPMHDEPVVIETYNDHRMAMAFAILGLVRPGISIADPGCVKKSYPGFWEDLARVAGAVVG